ncbi:MAG: prepilin-type N-terminal cleavage/methylation domain-containing protein [Candidatus Gastranaerophilales bacterium]|nr:prepilin-type N-terminal cleavage/methylation domain-containing protein [Candidatus Gastranaerophilales bacterium]
MDKYHAQKDDAFTLAEVLITLMVIGVLAAITIPSLVQSFEERAAVSQLRKTYAALQQAFKLAENENGPVASSYTTVSEYAKALTKYLPVIKDCGTQALGCAGKYKLINGDNYVESQEYYNVEGYNTAYKVVLNDGAGVYIFFSPGCNDSAYGSLYYKNKSCSLLTVGINGAKPPNLFGKDMFFFCNTTEGIVPSGGSSTSYCHIYHNASCKNMSSNGIGCARWVIERGNMNYLHKDTTW